MSKYWCYRFAAKQANGHKKATVKVAVKRNKKIKHSER